MELSDLLAEGSVIPRARVANKDELLRALAAKAAEQTRLDAAVIEQALSQREKLGSTGLGNGIAIPHGKIVGVRSVVAVFARLSPPIDYEAVDDQPVDLVMMLLAPFGAGADHLRALARVARLLRTEKVAEGLRRSADARELYRILAGRPAETRTRPEPTRRFA